MYIVVSVLVIVSVGVLYYLKTKEAEFMFDSYKEEKEKRISLEKELKDISSNVKEGNREDMEKLCASILILVKEVEKEASCPMTDLRLNFIKNNFVLPLNDMIEYNGVADSKIVREFLEWQERVYECS